MLYKKMDYAENLSWCRPFVSDRVSFTVKDGHIHDLMIDGKNVESDLSYQSGLNNYSEDTLTRAAKLCVDDYDCYSGYSAAELLTTLSDCGEVGCAQCPWRDSCDCMQEPTDRLNTAAMVKAAKAWLDKQDDMDDLVIDWESAHYDDDLDTWVMDATVEEDCYKLVAYSADDDEIEISLE